MFSFKSKEPKFVDPITDEKAHLKKGAIQYVNQAIGVLGPPGAGKSSLCCAYYKFLFSFDNKHFEMSTSKETFTKGIWILKESERRKIKGNIDRDILDVEGFQVDDIKSWKYVMIISFICSEIIILNRNTRLDDTKKVLNITKNSLKKMQESNIPKILKTIYIQIDDEDDIGKFNDKLQKMGYEPNSIEGVTIKPIYIPSFDKKRLKKTNYNILEVEDYKTDVSNSLQKLLNEKSTFQSRSSFKKYIDNLNMALDGKMNFDEQGIVKDLEEEYNNCYLCWESKKKSELLKKNFSSVRDINESFDSYIQRQNLDLSFEENLNDLTFYGSSDNFDDYYKSFGNKKSFKVDKSIFRNIYDSKINEKKIEEHKKGTEAQKELSKIEEYFEKQKYEIDRYFGSLKFYDYIDNKYSRCRMDINVTSQFTNKKEEFLNELYKYFDNKKSEKKQSWENQISRAKWRAVCQCEGELMCENGHTLNNKPVGCGGNCEGTLYWVDGPSHYCICDKCEKLSTLNDVICGGKTGCGARAKCKPKFTDFIP